MDPINYANLSNLQYIEALYAQYIQDPSSVDLSFKRFFEGMQFAEKLPAIEGKAEPPKNKENAKGDIRSYLLITAYKRYGSLFANLDPLASEAKELPKELDHKSYGFADHELGNSVDTFGFLPQPTIELKNLINALQGTYCQTLGVEYFHCDERVIAYIESRISPFMDYPFTPDEKKEILHELNRSEIFESFIHMKYPGQKRFSLEGGESMIPALLELYTTLAHHGATKSVLGMAHRGRLNVLANVLGKSYSSIFYEFDPSYIPNTFGGSGDVKYHLGMKAKLDLDEDLSHEIELIDNPSHLEAVNTVALGLCKAKQGSGDPLSVVPILIHGDASVAGQGVVYEGLQMMNLDGYSVGGSIHIVVNNQVGFTANAEETRSTRYPTDIAKGFGAPVFHVNGDDPESCCFAARLAAEIRQMFGVDVFIEIICYRKYGHNEGDEPAFTQPKLYEIIKKKPPVRNLYKEVLLKENILTEEEASKMEETFKQSLEEALKETATLVQKGKNEKLSFEKVEKVPLSEVFKKIETKVDKETLKKLAKVFCEIPDEVTPNPKVKKFLQERLQNVIDEKGIEWGLAETLAYASLIEQGISVRISGQDCQRGTFSHRHSMMTDQLTGKKYFPLKKIGEDTQFQAYNSCLSEYGVLGFEYGYSIGKPEDLTIWEAQFGDFANGAQIMIDQYISSSEQKWNLKSPLVLYLPHGYEGSGPEHSSGRIERFLQMSACYNMEVVQPTTTAQMFHLIRKHVLAKKTKPLIVFTPKALLRFAKASSNLQEFFEGQFEEILDDSQNNKQATRLLLCSGKIYYDLILEKEKRKADHIAIIRIEQLYPLHKEKLKEIISSYGSSKECFFIQDEPSNMGAYRFLEPQLLEILSDNLNLCYVGRARSASTAAGSMALHNHEKKLLLDQAFGKTKS